MSSLSRAWSWNQLQYEVEQSALDIYMNSFRAWPNESDRFSDH
jgi:hypothetical protein